MADRWQVPHDAAGDRLDRHLAQKYGLPRSQVQRWLRAGSVQIAGKPARASRVLSEGDEVVCSPPSTGPDAGLTAEAGELRVLWEDHSLVVVDKPAGLVVHPGAGRGAGTLVHRLLAAYPEIAGVGGPGRPGVVHRLDKDTSGVLVVARTDGAYHALAAAFAHRRVGKTYLAIAYGSPRQAAGTIDLPVGRHRSRRKEMTVRADGRPAQTGYRVLARAPGVSLLAITLHTGRTHQIRVHLKALGHPLVGDPVYGEARWRALPPAQREPLRRFARPALHAWRLLLRHPEDGRELGFEAPVPEDLRQLWEALSGAPWPVPATATPH